jgi:hypothetical protein
VAGELGRHLGWPLLLGLQDAWLVWWVRVGGRKLGLGETLVDGIRRGQDSTGKNMLLHLRRQRLRME